MSVMTAMPDRLGEALDQRIPGVARVARDGNGPVVAVVRLVAEVGVGLGLVLLVYRNKKTISLDDLSEMRG